MVYRVKVQESSLVRLEGNKVRAIGVKGSIQKKQRILERYKKSAKGRIRLQK